MDYVFPKFGDRELGLHAPVGKLVGDQFDRDHFARAGGRRADAAIFGLSDGDLRRHNLRGWRIHHGTADGMVSRSANSGIGQWLGHSLPRRQRSYSSLLHHGDTLLDCVLHRGGLLLAAGLRIRRGNCAKGQEASYGSLAYLPFLVGKLLVGTGGWLLAAFCPEHGPRHSGTMWLIFALAASIAPIGLIVSALTFACPRRDVNRRARSAV